MEEIRLKCRCLSKGKAAGEAIVAEKPISFLSAIDPKTGFVIEEGHELKGKCVRGKILIFPHGKGSTGASWSIYQMGVLGTGPAAMIAVESEPIDAVGAIMGNIPFVDSLELSPLDIIQTGDYVSVDADEGIVKVTRIRK